MDFRKPVNEIVEYIKGNSEQVHADLMARFPDFKPTVELSFNDNIHVVRVTLRDIAKEWNRENDGNSIVEDSGDDHKGFHYNTEYVKIPDYDNVFSSEVRAAKRQFLIDNPPSYDGFKMHLRNALIWDYCGSGGDQTITEFCDKQYESPHRLRAVIRVKENKFSATVSMSTRIGDSIHWGEYQDVYSIPAVKLTKFLKKIGMVELFCTKVAGRISNKPMRLSLHLTDLYIPECYIQMKSKVSSCMAKPSDCFDLPDYEHPTMAYEGSPDVMLALIMDEASTAEFPYVNRAIVRITDEGIQYCTSYGNQILQDLSPFGVQQEEWCMDGIKLTLINSDSGGVLAPYVDGTECRFYEDGMYLVCDDSKGHKPSSYETGRLGGDCYCEFCDRNYDDLRETYDGREVCDSCVDEYFTYVSGYGYVNNNDVVDARRSRHQWEATYEPDAVHSEYYNDHIIKCNAIYSDIVDSWIFEDDDEKALYLEVHGHEYDDGDDEDEVDDKADEKVERKIDSYIPYKEVSMTRNPIADDAWSVIFEL